MQNEQSTRKTNVTEARRGKRAVVSTVGDEASENDDDLSEDPDFQPGSDDSQDNEEDADFSDSPSDAYEDVEGSEDDDIFNNRNLSKQDMRQKLRQMRQKKKRGSKTQNTRVDGEDWYSDIEDEDELDSLSECEREKQKFPMFRGSENINSLEMTVGLRFPNAQIFREALRDWCVRKGYEIHFVNNENKRITVKCKHGCDWRLHASPIQGSVVFQIKTLKGHHTCARSNENDLATYKYLALRIEKHVRDDPDIGLQKLKQIIRRKCGIDINTFKAMRAKKAALSKIRGVDSKEYALLWDYCETVRDKNPGSRLILKKHPDTSPPMFDRMYFSIDAMKRAFLSGCRPIIGLDGCFLKTVYGGQLLVAVGRDGNDNMLPIALAVVQVENKDTWHWFIEELLQDIGDGRWTIISDRQKGLIEAVSQLLPHSEHRYCVRHLYQNFKVKFRSPAMKDLFWKAACTANKNEHEHWMKKLEEADPKIAANQETAAEWLRQIPVEHWCRAYFSTHCKSDILVNNICESFNNYILEARERPIISMFEWIRARLMTRIQVKRQGMEKYNGTICPNIQKKLNKCCELSRNCLPRWCGEEEFEVEHPGGKVVVDLFKKTCECGMFQLTGYPCQHACASILHNRNKVEDYVDPLYKKDVYMKIYGHMIHGVGGQSEFIKTNYEALMPPNFRPKRGRPKKLRRKSLAEDLPSSTRRGLTHICKNYLQSGHNKATCKNPTNPRSKLFKGNPSISQDREPQQNMSQGSSAPQPSQSESRPSKSSASQGCPNDGPPTSTSRKRTGGSQTNHGAQVSQKRKKAASLKQTSEAFATSKTSGGRARSHARAFSTQKNVTCTATAQSSRGIATSCAKSQVTSIGGTGSQTSLGGASGGKGKKAIGKRKSIIPLVAEDTREKANDQGKQ